MVASNMRRAKVLSAITAINPDVIHVHTPAGALAIASLARAVGGARWMYTARGGWDENVGNVRLAVWRAVDPARWPMWDQLTVINAWQTTTYGSKAVLLPNGGVPSRPRRPMGMTAEHVAGRLVWVGRLDRDKNPAHFVSLIERLRADGYVVQGHVVGDAVAGDRLPDGLQDRLSSNPHIVWHGWVDDPSHLMATADLLIHTSLREGYGLVFQEAAMVGVPSVAYMTHGTADSVRQVGGWLVEQGNVAGLAQRVAAWLQMHPEEQETCRQAVEARATTNAGRSVWQKLREVYE